jgi:hypothetical protein
LKGVGGFSAVKMSKPLRLVLSGLAGTIAITLVFLLHAAPSFGQTNQLQVTLSASYTLPTTRLKAAQDRAMPGMVPDDRGVNLGGLFSGLYHAKGDPDSIFYAIADRGPNGKVTVGKQRRRTFPVPEYNPVIYKLSAQGNSLQIIDEIPIRTRKGQPVTGLSNTDNDEVPYTYDGQTRLELNPNGIDTEGLARASDGTFWVCDEYSPSVAHITADGTLVHRLVPEGMTLAADTDVRLVLPAIYAKRRLNRGFEGLTISSDDTRLFIALQSPLDFPTKEIGRASRMMRLLVVDTQKLMPIAEYVYVVEPVSSFGETDQGKMKIGDVAFVNPTTLLLSERTDKVARIYQVDLTGATNLLGTRWSDPQNTSNSLEALTPEQLAINGITPVKKSLVADLSKVPGMPNKIEGLTILDPTTIAVGNDNDFGFDSFDAAGRAVNNNLTNHLLMLRLSQALPLSR